MNVFELRRSLIDDYSAYARSFVTILDDRIEAAVEEELRSGLLWPEPLVQLNPAFEAGGSIDELVGRGLLHPECSKIFRIKSAQNDPGRPLNLHRHQTEAIEAAAAEANYVVTTGTGSGKSLAYIVPIVDRVLRAGSGHGIKAIVVYPMNALANSQVGELEKFLNFGYPDGKGPVRFARYTGQEDDEERKRILQEPPDIILTNYVMLELILTRPFEKELIRAARDLRFLVFDELHTYRGRQGADVALLARRIREACGASRVQHVGTSATMTTRGTFDEQRAEVSSVASRLFGEPVAPEHVIVESLRRATVRSDLQDPAYVQALTAAADGGTPPTDHAAFVADPLAAWMESTLGVREDKVGRLIRQRARPITGPEGVASTLADLTGVDLGTATVALQRWLLAGYQLPDPATGLRTFAFKLHQFVSRGETVYASIEPADRRHITAEGQRFAPGDRSRVLFPLAFCRECGQEYYAVWLKGSDDARSVAERELRALKGDELGEPGFVFVGDWPIDTQEMLVRLPDDWKEANGSVKRSQKGNLPLNLRLRTDGSEGADGTDAVFLRAPFRFCLTCGVAYSATQRSDFAKLATLGTGGRTTATTILSLSIVRGLRREESLDVKARKLLAFTDNRQDASLQAGHFNDFILTSLVRSGLFKAAKASRNGLAHDVLAQSVMDALDLDPVHYAIDSEVRYQAKTETDKALRNVIGYRLYRDLLRGWRVTSPNLEQCGLLRIEYQSLDELCANDGEWVGTHPALTTASAEDRMKVGSVLLDYMRRELAIKVDYLDETFQEQLKQQSSAKLVAPWAIDEGENLEFAKVLFPRSERQGDYRGWTFLSPRGGFGQYLRRRGTLPNAGHAISVEDTKGLLEDLFSCLKIAGLVEIIVPKGDGEGDVAGYQLPAAAMLWRAGDGVSGVDDPIRVPLAPEGGRRTNPFFVGFYQTVADDAKGLEAREHTAQVPAKIREEREHDFREAKLPLLFCSPTMELGVDIADLNAVGLRNVPPTAANYAQRSGRAGRSGQPALIVTYCATGSSHDQYYFRRPDLMVSGAVAPPRIDLANEDLVRSHVQAVWLAEAGPYLGTSLRDVLDVAGENPSLELLASIRHDIEDPTAAGRAKARAASIVATIAPELAGAIWFTPTWLDEVVDGAGLALDEACQRWRSLHRAATEQWERQNKIIRDASKTPREKELAKSLRREAEGQLELLTAENKASLIQSDFYSYRYFASEGFLPGYSFPRLPLSAYLPGRGKGVKKSEDEYVSRPRFLAISEFGPRSFIYHEGSRYIVNRVMIPVDERASEGDLPTRSAKWCANCGYLHPVADGVGVDLCERCHNPLDAAISNLFRLQNVSAKRRDRISSDEEERMRMGYDIRTAVRFAERGGRSDIRTAEVEIAGRRIARLTFGSAATLWRVNLGWRRNTVQGQRGFVLDTQNGYWAKNEANDVDVDDPMSASNQRVVPFVEDRKNSLLIEFDEPLARASSASVQWALQRAIGVRYQLEERELAVEPLPNDVDRKILLLYESAEGGAGVLHRLVDDPGALAQVAAEALSICHYDRSTGEDLGRAAGARQDCEAACYDCLMSYANQREHILLDRRLVRDVLLELQAAVVKAAPVAEPRDVHLERLRSLCGSGLERQWLDFLEERQLGLPSHAQRFFEDCAARPDFFYADHLAVVYIDGPPHDFAERQARDETQENCLRDLGYSVIRFVHRDDWELVAAKYPNIFGVPR